jgi:hypothetical protein
MIDQSEILSRNQVQFITLFFGGAELCCTFTSHGKLHAFGAKQNKNPELNRHSLTFLQ